MENFNTQVEEVINFIENLKKENLINPESNNEFVELWKIEKTEGKKYIKLICGRCVYCFIDKENGDILKAAGWEKPAKHARGNIFKPEGWKSNLNVYGPLHLR